MGTAASSTGVKGSPGNLKAKASYLLLVIPVLGIGALLWKATHDITKPDVSIYRAAEEGDFKDVRAHVLTGTPVNSLSSEGHSPLYYAVMSGNRDIVELLLQNGASPNAEARGQVTPLYVAAGQGDIRLVKDLIAAGADPKENNHTSATPLYAAADSGKPEVVKLLLDLGADPNVAIKNSGTALSNACIKGNLECVNLLLDHGADVNAPGFDGRKPIRYAVQSGHYEIVKRLLDKGASADATDAHFVLALSTALQNRVDKRISWLLFDKMTTYRNLDYHSRNLLHYAADGGIDVKMVKLLLAKGVDPNQVDYLGDTPLSLAISRGHKDIENALLAGGARITLNQLIHEALESPLPVGGRSSARNTS